MPRAEKYGDCKTIPGFSRSNLQMRAALKGPIVLYKVRLRIKCAHLYKKKIEFVSAEMPHQEFIDFENTQNRKIWAL